MGTGLDSNTARYREPLRDNENNTGLWWIIYLQWIYFTLYQLNLNNVKKSILQYFSSL